MPPLPPIQLYVQLPAPGGHPPFAFGCYLVTCCDGVVPGGPSYDGRRGESDDQPPDGGEAGDVGSDSRPLPSRTVHK